MKVLKFGAVWCKECLVMRSMWEEIEKEVTGFESEYFDIDEEDGLLGEYDVRSVPAFIFMDKEGNEIERLKGVQNKEELVSVIKNNLEK